MLRFSASLLFLCVLAFNSHASSIPQPASTGVDGDFNLLNGNDTLFSSTDNIYNFINFSIADGATLNIASSGPVYIYAQQSIIIGGNLFADSSDLHFIAPTIETAGNANISANGSITLILTDSSASNPGGNASSGNGITIDSGNPNISPVPLPAAIWLMLSGLLSLGALKLGVLRKHQS